MRSLVLASVMVGGALTSVMVSQKNFQREEGAGAKKKKKYDRRRGKLGMDAVAIRDDTSNRHVEKYRAI